MSYHDIAAVVLHFRTPKCTLDCLSSLANEGVGRILVIDNSVDGGRSLQEIEGALDRVRQTGTSVDIFVSDTNLGFARGVNTGLDIITKSQTNADILVVNSDARLECGALRKMVKALDAAMVVIPMARKQVGAQLFSLFGFYQPLFALVTRRQWLGSLRYPSGCCLLFRSDFVVGELFDRDFFFYGEDAMLGHTLQKRGVFISECEAAVVVHAGSASASNGSMFYEYHINRGHWLLSIKLSKSFLGRLLFICMRCLTLSARACVRSIRFRSFVPWRALFAASMDFLMGQCRDLTPPVK